MKNILISVWRRISKSFYYYLLKIKFDSAKRTASRLHNLDGKTYYVIRLQNKYHVFNSLDIKELKRKRIFKRELNFHELTKHVAFTAK